MATIKKSDIYDGNTAKAEHITRIIDSLDGTSAAEIIATGSFTGSFAGDGSGLTGVTANNFANTDLTFTGPRLHNTNGNSFYVSSDGGTFGQNYIGFENNTLFNTQSLPVTTIGVYTSSVVASGDNYIQAYSIPGYSGIYEYVKIASENVTAITAYYDKINFNENGVDMDFQFNTDTDANTLFIEGSTDRIGIGKNTPNAKLDVDGDTIITGSLTVDGDTIITGSLTVHGKTNRINGLTRTTQDSKVVTNSSAIVGHPSGSGIYPGMIGNIDLNPSATNAIIYVLGPLTEYTLGDRYEFQIVNYNGDGEEFRVDVNSADTSRMNAQVFGADGTNVIQSNISSVRFGVGNSYSADRVIVTACRSGIGGTPTLWNVQAYVSGGAGVTTA